MKRQKILALIMAIILVVGLSACGDSAPEPGQQTPGESTQEPAAPADDSQPAEADDDAAPGGSLNVALWDKNQEVAITPILKEWGEANGISISVDVTPWSDYWTMLEASATGGSMPDVFWMHSNQVRRYANNDLLMDLTDKIAASSEVDLSAFPADITSIYTVNDKNYGIPKDLDTIAMWYNKAMFDEAELAYPDDTWTWDDLKNAATLLTKEDGSQKGFVWAATANQEVYYNFIYQNGGYVISDDQKSSGYSDPKTIEAMEFLVSFIEEGIAPDAIIAAENEMAALLESGSVAIGLQGSWMLGEFGTNDYMVENFDCTVMPSGRDGTRATIYNGLGWSAAANTSNPDAAWALLEWLGSEEAQVKMGEAGVCNISAHKAGQAAWGNSDPRFNLQAYVDQVQYGVPYPSSINTVVWEAVVREKTGEMMQVQRPVADICQEINDTMNEMLAEE